MGRFPKNGCGGDSAYPLQRVTCEETSEIIHSNFLPWKCRHPDVVWNSPVMNPLGLPILFLNSPM